MVKAMGLPINCGIQRLWAIDRLGNRLVEDRIPIKEKNVFSVIENSLKTFTLYFCAYVLRSEKAFAILSLKKVCVYLRKMDEDVISSTHTQIIRNREMFLKHLQTVVKRDFPSQIDHEKMCTWIGVLEWFYNGAENLSQTVIRDLQIQDEEKAEEIIQDATRIWGHSEDVKQILQSLDLQWLKLRVRIENYTSSFFAKDPSVKIEKFFDNLNIIFSEVIQKYES
jgi:hypothetical protein